MTCIYIISQVQMSLSAEKKTHLRELYRYGRGLMGTYSGRGNVLMGTYPPFSVLSYHSLNMTSPDYLLRSLPAII